METPDKQATTIVLVAVFPIYPTRNVASKDIDAIRSDLSSKGKV